MPDERQIFPPKTIATKVKHLILEAYLKAWGGIIINSNRQNAIRLTFVDTCCGSGLYAPSEDEASAPEFDVGSALIGLNVLNELNKNAAAGGIRIETKAIFVNKESTELDTLASAIAAQPAGLTKHDMLHGALSDQVAAIVRHCERSFAFIFIDPFGPSAIPFSVVSPLVDLRYADCLINFPYYSVQKWSGWLGSGQQESRLQIVDALMNGSRWRDLARASSGEDLELRLLREYISSLTEHGVGAIAVPMLFEDRARTMYHLVFTSHNTAGLAAAKEKLLKGEAHQAALRSELKSMRTAQNAFDFMAAGTDPDPVDVEDLAGLLADQFRAQHVTFDEVVRRALLEPNVLLGHVNRALTVLKKHNRVSRAGKKWSDLVTFHNIDMA